jgi:hypothetical protein
MIAARYQHDYGGIGTRKMFCRTSHASATPDMAAADALRQAAAPPTKAVGSMPMYHRPCISQQRAILLRKQCANLTQIAKLANAL